MNEMLRAVPLRTSADFMEKAKKAIVDLADVINIPEANPAEYVAVLLVSAYLDGRLDELSQWKQTGKKT